MKKIIVLLGSLSILTLAGCAAKHDSEELRTTEHVEAVNQASQRASSEKAADDAAKKHNGTTWQAANDHIVSAKAAATAVTQTISSAKKLQVIPVPEANVDSQGHHYYQVDTFKKNATRSKPSLIETYFVYPDGQITTRQAN